MKHIFLVEDDLSLINGLSFALKKQGYELTVARTGREAEQLWEKEKYDLVILDVTLPDRSGFDLCRKFRETSKIPIMFLTAADEETDIIMGLDIGGDDYMTKPFKLAIFLSRVNALLRRSENFNQADTELNSNGIKVQLLKGAVYKNGELLDLTASEYKLLCLFMENPDIVLSPEQILGRLWDCDENYIDSSTLTGKIRYLIYQIKVIIHSFYPLMLNTAKRSRTTVEALELKGYRYAAVNKEVKKMKLAALKITCDDLLFLAISFLWVAVVVLVSLLIG